MACLASWTVFCDFHDFLAGVKQEYNIFVQSALCYGRAVHAIIG